MKILFVSSQALFRETRFGGAKRLYYLAKELEARAELHLICLDGCGEIPEGGDMPREFDRLLFLPRERNLSLLDKLPFLPDVPMALETNRRAIADFLGDTRFDATFLAFTGALYFADKNLIPFPGRTVYLEDDLLLEQVRRSIISAANPGKRLLKSLRHKQGGALYDRGLKNVSEFVCISAQEEDVVRALWPGIGTKLLGYGIPLENYPLLADSGRRDVLGFIGNYRHLPNLDAVRWLVRELFPVVVARLPHARLVLCGSAFPADLREACRGNASIVIMDEVEDLATFYRSISVFVNPVREGRGLRTKVVEAAAYGRPVLSTPLGAEGLEDLELGLFDDAEGLLAGLRALSLPEAQARMVAHNRAAVERLFSMEEVGRQLMTILSPG